MMIININNAIASFTAHMPIIEWILYSLLFTIVLTTICDVSQSIVVVVVRRPTSYLSWIDRGDGGRRWSMRQYNSNWTKTYISSYRVGTCVVCVICVCVPRATRPSIHPSIHQLCVDVNVFYVRPSRWLRIEIKNFHVQVFYAVHDTPGNSCGVFNHSIDCLCHKRCSSFTQNNRD